MLVICRPHAVRQRGIQRVKLLHISGARANASPPAGRRGWPCRHVVPSPVLNIPRLPALSPAESSGGRSTQGDSRENVPGLQKRPASTFFDSFLIITSKTDRGNAEKPLIQFISCNFIRNIQNIQKNMDRLPEILSLKALIFSGLLIAVHTQGVKRGTGLHAAANWSMPTLLTFS